MIGRIFRGEEGRWPRRAGTAAAAALLVGAPIVGADGTAPEPPLRGDSALDAAAAWRDTLTAVRAPALPSPGESESVIVVFSGKGSSAVGPAARAARAEEISLEQSRIEPVLGGLGATVTHRYRVLMNAVAIRLPVGRVSQVVALPEVEAVYPVTFLSPATIGGLPLPGSDSETASDVSPSGSVAPLVLGDDAPAVMSLIDGGVDASHPALGGGIGPTYPIIGGHDFVDGDDDPSLGTGPLHLESHGTAMAGIALGAPELDGLPPTEAPRLIAHRVVALEESGGSVQPFARSDRVIAALEASVDPDGDGDVSDRVDVILIGLARGFDGAGPDPLADAVWRAESLGSVVVAPAGNDGPSLSGVGTVGGPAASPAVLTVGGLAENSARQVTLQVGVGPASAGLEGLPLLGGASASGSLPVVFATSLDGQLLAGDAPGDFLDDDGRSVVSGSMAVVSRSGASLRDKAANAAAAGAAAIAVWDTAGSGAFPGIDGGADWPLPVVGLGARQGQALADLAAARPEARVEMRERRSSPSGMRPASFSSRGAGPTGLAKPDISAPAVAVEAPYPGGVMTAVTGTSAAAARVAAAALRIRVDDDRASSLYVRSALVQGAVRVGDAGLSDVGAGALAEPATPSVVIDPPIISAEQGSGARDAITIALQSQDDQPQSVRMVHVAGDGTRTDVGGAVRLAPGVRAGRRLKIPADDTGRGRLLVVSADSAAPLGVAPVTRRARVTTPKSALGIPEITTGSGLASVSAQIGRLERREGRLDSVRLHDVRVELLPDGGGDPLLVTGEKQPGEWAAGRYRLLLAQRLADGTPRSAGIYRVRVTARGPDGRRLTRVSAPRELN